MPADASRDGRAVDDIGYYNPLPNPSAIKIDMDKARSWIRSGALPTDRVWKLLEAAQPGFRETLKEVKPAEESAETAAPLAAAKAKPSAKAKAKPAAKAKAKPAAKAKAKPAAKAKAKAKAKSGSKKS